MKDTGYICTKCNSEQAKFGCISYSEFSLIGSSCLMTLLSQPLFLLPLSFSKSFLSSPVSFEKYISNPNSYSSYPAISPSLFHDLSLSLSLSLMPLNPKYIPFSSLDGNLFLYSLPQKAVYPIQLPASHSFQSLICLDDHSILITCSSSKGTPSIFLSSYPYSNLRPVPYTPNSRYLTHILSYSNYLYFIIGCSSKTYPDVRLNMYTNRLEILPRRKHHKIEIACVNIGNRIYVFYIPYSIAEVLKENAKEYEEIQFVNSEESFCSGAVVAEKQRIYIITSYLIQIYDEELIKLAQIAMRSELFHGEVSYLEVYNDNLYYLNTESMIIQHRDIATFKYKPRVRYENSLPSSRYIYISNYFLPWHSLDLKHKFAIPLQYDDFSQSLYDLCELPNGRLLLRTWGSWLIYTLSTSSYQIIPERIYKNNTNSLIYSSGYIYSFEKSAIIRLDLDSFSYEEICNTDIISERFFPSMNVIDSKIVITGGGIDTIDIYDIETNQYYITELKIESKYAVSKYVNERLYVIYDNRYMILSRDLEVLMEGEVDYRRYDIKIASTVGVYKDRIYFFNRDTGLLEYFDMKELKRGAEAVEISV